MTVCNRSNDMIWGLLGANAFHFSFLHQVMAESIGVPMGYYYQFSNNAHFYQNEHFTPEAWIGQEEEANKDVRYGYLSRDPIKITLGSGSFEDFLAECNRFMHHVVQCCESKETKVFSTKNLWFDYAATMLNCHILHKVGNTESAMLLTDHIGDPALGRACLKWLESRVK